MSELPTYRPNPLTNRASPTLRFAVRSIAFLGLLCVAWTTSLFVSPSSFEDTVNEDGRVLSVSGEDYIQTEPGRLHSLAVNTEHSTYQDTPSTNTHTNSRTYTPSDQHVTPHPPKTTKRKLQTSPTPSSGDDSINNNPFVIMLKILGVLYMFIALAIVCDEFFVPALEVISGKLELSNDIAGATLMAAGGSAPELFTSLVGTFSDSSIGFGTIVGSAVFNVMFVIGVCAVSSSKVLDLNWWPLARDCSYYALVLCLLAYFMSDNVIYMYEAGILFALYFGYVYIMSNNIRILSFILSRILKKDEIYIELAIEELNEERTLSLTAPTGFRAGLLSFITGAGSLADTAGTAIVCQISGDVKATFEQLDTDKSGFVDAFELGNLLRLISGHKPSSKEVKELLLEVDKDGDGKLTFEEFTQWYLKSQVRIESDVRKAFDRFDLSKSGFLNKGDIENALLILNGTSGDSYAVEVAVEQISNNASNNVVSGNGSSNGNGSNSSSNSENGNSGSGNDGFISFTNFHEYYMNSNLRIKRESVMQEQAKASEGMSLRCPEDAGFVGKTNYFVTLPLVFAMYITIPDVRAAGYGNYAYFSFTISIFWIGIFSYFMVGWAGSVGKSFGIPEVIMGLTVLAAGTSVPDLLSSVIVAKQGHGDMAVSSSIGSNIFDVLIGLPFPWLLYGLYHTILNAINDTSNPTLPSVGGASSGGDGGIIISIFILIGMLAIVVGSVKYNGWKMTKNMGYFYFFCYAMFVTEELLRADWSGDTD